MNSGNPGNSGFGLGFGLGLSMNLSQNVEVKIEPDIASLLNAQEYQPPAPQQSASAGKSSQAAKVHQKPHPCHLCTKVFGRKDHLTRHVKTVHTRPTTYLCRLCGKLFDSHPDLTTHYKFQHPGVEPPSSDESAHSSGGPDANGLVEARIFRCGLCGKAFNRNDHLNRHVKFVHTQDKFQEKKVECFQCGERFRTNNEVKNHMEIVHLAVGLTYDCPDCLKPFPNYLKLKKHVESTHIRKNL